MECPKCHYRLAQASRFCPNCGHGLAAAVAPKAAVPVAQAAPVPGAFVPRKQPLWPLVLGFLLIGAGSLFFAFRSGLLKVPGEPVKPKVLLADGTANTGELLKADGTANSGQLLRTEGTAPQAELLRVYGTPPASNLTQTQAEKISMPADVLAYLQHVERIEGMRVKMSRKQLSEALIMFTEMSGLRGGIDAVRDLADPDAPTPDPEDAPSKKVGRSAEDKRRDWRTLEEQFLAVNPPAECVTLRNEYQTALHETGTMISEILDAIEQASESPEAALTALQGMQNTSGGRIDVKARAADGTVAAICRKYLTDKWFSITGDVGGGSMVGLGIGGH
ncbi:MAG: hypothetical protein JNJ45_01030 [Chthonomonas sp.]|nr:hypothetical protein [Chthonomonas sp.]